MAGVNICLISKDGSAVLHRISSVNDPRDNLQVMQQICSVSGHLAAAAQLPGDMLDMRHSVVVPR
jgi:hypothetical protein